MTLFAAVVALASGAALVGTWTMLIVGRSVPELAERQRSMLFHLGAEALAAALLLAGGAVLIASDAPWATALAAAGLGALLYTAVNSAGYYAERGDRSVVAAFGAIAALAGAALAVLLAAA